MQHRFRAILMAMLMPSLATAESIDLFGKGNIFTGNIFTGKIVGEVSRPADVTFDLGAISSVARPISAMEVQSKLDAGGTLMLESPGSAILFSGAGYDPARVIVPSPDGKELLGFRICELLGTCTTAPE